MRIVKYFRNEWRLIPLIVYLISLVGLNVTVFNVSMGEPYTTVELNELIWQLMIPSILIGTQMILIPLVLIKHFSLGTKTKYLSVSIMLFLLILEFATVYGYLNEIKL